MIIFFFQAEDGIRDAQESRGLGDVYKRQVKYLCQALPDRRFARGSRSINCDVMRKRHVPFPTCLLYTSDAADDLLCVDLGGRRIIKKKNSAHAASTTPTISFPVFSSHFPPLPSSSITLS